MKTITLQGEFQKFENLKQATSKFDEDRLPYEVETRVYVVDADFNDYYAILSDDEFIKLAKEQGRVYTIQGFQEAFNLEAINSSIDVIRFINVVKND
jgi:hypothetical protein